MNSDRLEAHLQNWKNWMRHGGLEELAMPSRVPVIGIRHNTSFDDMIEDMDRMTAKATDAAIADLKRLEREAIHHNYLGTEWRNDYANIHVVLVVAREAIRQSLVRRGVA